MPSLYRKAGVLLGSAVLSQILALASLPLIALLYSPIDLGIAQIFTSMLTMLGIVTCGKLDQGILVAPEPQVTRMLAAASGVIAVMAGSLTIGLVAFALFGGHNISVFLILVPAVVASGFGQLINAIALRKLAYNDIARTKIEQSVLNIISLAGFGAAKFGVYGLVIAQIVQQTGGLFRLRKRVAPEFTWDTIWNLRHELKAVIKANPHLIWSATSAGLINSLAWTIPVLAIAHYYGAAQAGIFALAMKCLSPVSIFLISTVNQISMGEGSNLLITDNHAGIRKQTLKLCKITVALALLVAFAGYGVAYAVDHYLADWEWSGISLYLGPLAVLVAMQLAINPLTSLAVLYKKQTSQVLYDISRALLVACIFYAAGTLKWSLEFLLNVYVLAMSITYLFYANFFLKITRPRPIIGCPHVDV